MIHAVVGVERERPARRGLIDDADVGEVAEVGVVVVALGPADVVEVDGQRRHRRQHQRHAERLGGVVVEHVVPAVDEHDRGRDLVVERVGQLEPGVGERDGPGEQERAAEVVVVAVVAVDELGADRRDELAGVDAQALADGNDVGGERLLEIEVAGDAGRRIAEQAARGGDVGHRAHGDVDAEAEVTAVGHRLLHHQLGRVDAKRVVIVIEGAELVDVVLRVVEVPGVGRRGIGIHRNELEPGLRRLVAECSLRPRQRQKASDCADTSPVPCKPLHGHLRSAR